MPAPKKAPAATKAPKAPAAEELAPVVPVVPVAEIVPSAPEPELPSDKELAGIEVGDPEFLRPVELPLVVKSKSGEWANAEQAEFAATLNAYAYKNPKKWASKKAALLRELVDLEKHPENILRLRGAETRLGYKNKLVESE